MEGGRPYVRVGHRVDLISSFLEAIVLKLGDVTHEYTEILTLENTRLYIAHQLKLIALVIEVW